MIKRGLVFGADRDMEQRIAQSVAGMIRIHGINAQAEANVEAARMARMNDAEGEKTWRAIAQGIEKLRACIASGNLVQGTSAAMTDGSSPEMRTPP
jgi:hypothetical protein